MNVFVVQSSSHNPHPEIKMRNQIITYIANISLVMKSSIMAVAWKLMYSVCVSYLSWLMILKQFLTGNMNLELRIGQCAKESCVPRNIMRDMEGWREKEREYNMRDLTVESVGRPCAMNSIRELGKVKLIGLHADWLQEVPSSEGKTVWIRLKLVYNWICVIVGYFDVNTAHWNPLIHLLLKPLNTF